MSFRVLSRGNHSIGLLCVAVLKTLTLETERAYMRLNKDFRNRKVSIKMNPLRVSTI